MGGSLSGWMDMLGRVFELFGYGADWLVDVTAVFRSNSLD